MDVLQFVSFYISVILSQVVGLLLAYWLGVTPAEFDGIVMIPPFTPFVEANACYECIISSTFPVQLLPLALAYWARHVLLKPIPTLKDGGSTYLDWARIQTVFFFCNCVAVTAGMLFARQGNVQIAQFIAVPIIFATLCHYSSKLAAPVAGSDTNPTV